MNKLIQEKREAVALLAQQASVEALSSLLNLTWPTEIQHQIHQTLDGLRCSTTITDIAKASAQAAQRAKIILESTGRQSGYELFAANATYAAYYAAQAARTLDSREVASYSEYAVAWAMKAFNPRAANNSKRKMKSFIAPYAFTADHAAQAAEELFQLIATPPKLASGLLHQVVPSEDFDWLGDIEEVYYSLHKKHGASPAQRFYWEQTLHSIYYGCKVRFIRKFEQTKGRINASKG